MLSQIRRYVSGIKIEGEKGSDGDRSARFPSTAQLWGAVFVAFALLYVATCQRGVSWQDSGAFQWRILTNDYLGSFRSLGLALSHPLYIGIGQIAKLGPMESFPFRVNALSGIGMGMTLANVACVVRYVTNRWCLSVLTTAVLGVSHAAWFLSTIAEVYVWSTALFSAELWLLAWLVDAPGRYKLLPLFGLNGLGLCIHNFALLPLPIYAGAAIWLWKRGDLSRTDLGWAAGGYLIGAAPFLSIVAWAVPKLGGLFPAIRSALVGKFGGAVFNTSFDWGLAWVNFALGSLSFANVLPILALVGLGALLRSRRPLGFVFGGIAFMHLAFVVRYSVNDTFTFLLPTLVSMTVLAGMGADVLLDQSRQWRTWVTAGLLASIVLPPIGYAIGPVVLDAVGMTIERQRSLPYRQEAQYWLVPWKHNERSAQRFAQEALAQTQEDDLIIADVTVDDALRLRKRLAPSAAVRIAGSHEIAPSDVHSVFQNGVVYVVSPVPGYTASWILRAASFERDGVLYRMTTLLPRSKYGHAPE